MKKYAFLIAASLLLAACGTTEEGQPVENETTSSIVESTDTENGTTKIEETENGTAEIEEVEVEEAEVETVEEVTNPQQTTSSTETSTTPEPAKPAEQTKPVTTVSDYTPSPEQKYEISLQEGFSLVAEEPGRDMVVYEANDRISMRIETFAKAETTYEKMAQLAKETVEVTAPEGQYETVDLTNLRAENSDVLNAAGYKIVYAEDAEQSITAIFENADKIVQLTVFDTTENAFTNTLLQMGFSIQ